MGHSSWESPGGIAIRDYKKCKEEGCETRGTSQGRCYTHWVAWLFPDDEALIEEALHMCANKGCLNPARHRGDAERFTPTLCASCYTSIKSGRPFPAVSGDYPDCATCGTVVDHADMPSGTQYCSKCRTERTRLTQNKASRAYRARKKAAAT